MTEVIQSKIQTSSEEFRSNHSHHAALAEEVRQAVDRVRCGGSPEAVDRHHKRGKLLPRERIDRILDPGAPFLELSPLAANGMYDDAAPGAGLVTGIRSRSSRCHHLTHARLHVPRRYLQPGGRLSALESMRSSTRLFCLLGCS